MQIEERVAGYGPLLRAIVTGLSDNVMVKDPAGLEGKLASFVEASPSRLHVVADFDRTVTRFWNERESKEMMPSSHGVIDQSPLLGEKFKAYVRDLFNIYYPIETSIYLAPAEREAKMIEWWTKAHNAYKEHNLTRDMLDEMLATATLKLRPLSAELFKDLRELEVPVHVFSAGIANIIELFLAREGVLDLDSNVHVIGNRMLFATDGRLEGFAKGLIHSCNKSGELIIDHHASPAQTKRDHLILLGDSMGDLRMSEGLPVTSTITIGFLNDRIEERTEQFVNSFDMVVMDDGTMGVVRNIVALMRGSLKTA